MGCTRLELTNYLLIYMVWSVRRKEEIFERELGLLTSMFSLGEVDLAALG